jgi:hypothetical protein
LSSLIGTPEMKGIGYYGLAGLAAADGHTEDALSYLMQSINTTVHAIRWAERDIAWIALRDDHRFRKLINLPL